jgi:hypothetical protein
LGSHAVEVRPIIKAGFEFGGDTVVTVGVTGSSGSSTRSVKANQGVFFGGGVSFLTDSKNLEVEVSLAYKFFTIAAQNGHLDWSVLPLDALVFYRMPSVRLGGGATYHLSPTLSGSGAASDLNAKYGDALGLVLQADYVLKNRFNFGVRYTNVSYKVNGTPRASNTVDSNVPASNPKTAGLGFVFSMSF